MKIILSLLLSLSFINNDSSVTETSKEREVSFINPVHENAVVLSNFGLRTHPLLNKERMHTGVDFQAMEGDQVKASEKGTIIFASEKDTFGSMVIIEHADGFVTRYAHLDSFEKEIAKGTAVEKGQTIGLAGKSGFANSPVLHFEILLDGEAKDPLSYLE